MPRPPARASSTRPRKQRFQSRAQLPFGTTGQFCRIEGWGSVKIAPAACVSARAGDALDACYSCGTRSRDDPREAGLEPDDPMGAASGRQLAGVQRRAPGRNCRPRPRSAGRLALEHRRGQTTKGVAERIRPSDDVARRPSGGGRVLGKMAHRGGPQAGYRAGGAAKPSGRRAGQKQAAEKGGSRCGQAPFACETRLIGVASPRSGEPARSCRHCTAHADRSSSRALAEACQISQADTAMRSPQLWLIEAGDGVMLRTQEDLEFVLLQGARRDRHRRSSRDLSVVRNSIDPGGRVVLLPPQLGNSREACEEAQRRRRTLRSRSPALPASRCPVVLRPADDDEGVRQKSRWTRKRAWTISS
jgi:hypothetical protein